MLPMPQVSAPLASHVFAEPSCLAKRSSTKQWTSAGHQLDVFLLEGIFLSERAPLLLGCSSLIMTFESIRKPGS